MVLSRLGFGHWGNVLPAGLNSVVAGIGWFAVNSVSGAFALNVLTHLPKVGCLLIIVVVQVVVAFFGYAVGWNPYASDYTRYFKPDSSRAAIGWWSGAGLFLSCALLEIVGAAVGTSVGAGNALAGPGGMTSLLATPLADATLLAIALGAVSANVLNIYSGALSFTALGIKLPLSLRRAAVALGFGTIGFFLAWSGLHDAGSKYQNFLLIIAYWIAPWLAVMFCDMLLRKNPDESLLFATGRSNWAGPVAMLAGMGISIWLFSNQTEYVGPVPSHVPSVGDLTFEAGFVITAVVYLAWHAIARTGRAKTLAG